MTTLRTTLPLLLAATTLHAQGPDFLYTAKVPELARSGSAGTNLRFLNPNEILALEFTTMSCNVLSAEKWAPRTSSNTMAGDENGDGVYWNPAIFGEIDALVTSIGSTPTGITNQRNVFWSPSAAMGTVVSGGAGLRPGDVGRIVRNTTGDGKVQYFIRAEQIQQALGLPITPIVVDVDAIAFSPNHGVFFSLDGNHAVAAACGVTSILDGDVLVIPPSSLTYTADMRIGAVAPGSAHVLYTEAQMNTFTANAAVADRFGGCVTSIVDTEALEIDFAGPTFFIPGCTGTALVVPTLLFTGETLTGGAILTTQGGGQIHVAPCGPLGTPCGAGPTLGLQIGLRPPSAAMGVPSFVNALTHTRHCRFVTEARNHVIASPAPAVIDVACPAPMSWMFFNFAPTGVGAVAPSLPFGFGFLCFPDYYVNTFMNTVPTPGGFGTYTSPVIPWPCKTVWQAVTITSAGGIEISTPTTVDVN